MKTTNENILSKQSNTENETELPDNNQTLLT